MPTTFAVVDFLRSEHASYEQNILPKEYNQEAILGTFVRSVPCGGSVQDTNVASKFETIAFYPPANYSIFVEVTERTYALV